MTNRGPGPIPNRWLHCPRKSDTVIAERFLAFKTPLSNAYKDDIPLDCVFPPEMIFGYCKALKLKLGLWIDLTNTTRFYDREVVESRGVKYMKLQCRGHGETPSPEQTRSFIEVVAAFIDDRPLDIIAVHCTHGFNRTGFLIASYLVERLDCSVEAALSMFANARPPGIYKQDYINELYRRYEDENDATLAPELPDWCLEYDDSNVASSSGANMTRKRKYDVMSSATTSQEAQRMRSSNSITQNGNLSDEVDEEESRDSDLAANGANAKKSKKRRREMVIKNATFMPGVPGVVLVTDQPRLSELQIMVQDMCGWDKSGFPGSQPVSMDRKNIELLSKNPYRVSWKADGTRYMMLIKTRDEIYFFDRNFSCFQVENLSFVKSRNLNEHLENTLLDGEMVIDMLGEQSIPRYLIYDIVCFLSEDIGKRPFYPDRLNCIVNEIYTPRQKAKDFKIINRSKEPFSIHYKDFWDIRKSDSLLGEKFAKSLLHKPDGLIFQPSKTPYTAGVSPDVLKWKPQNMNSVDFRLKISMESGVGILNKKIGLLYVGGYDMPIEKIKYTKALKEFDNKIIECTLNKYGQWEFLRDRPDKTLPNSHNTAKAVTESIKNPVTKRFLLDYIMQHGFGDDKDKDKMPPPSSHARQSTSQHAHHYQQQQNGHQQKQQHGHQQQQQHQHPQQHHHQQQHQQQYQNHRPPPNPGRD